MHTWYHCPGERIERFYYKTYNRKIRAKAPMSVSTQLKHVTNLGLGRPLMPVKLLFLCIVDRYLDSLWNPDHIDLQQQNSIITFIVLCIDLLMLITGPAWKVQEVVNPVSFELPTTCDWHATYKPLLIGSSFKTIRGKGATDER